MCGPAEGSERLRAGRANNTSTQAHSQAVPVPSRSVQGRRSDGGTQNHGRAKENSFDGPQRRWSKRGSGLGWEEAGKVDDAWAMRWGARGGEIGQGSGGVNEAGCDGVGVAEAALEGNGRPAGVGLERRCSLQRWWSLCPVSCKVCAAGRGGGGLRAGVGVIEAG